MAHGNLIRYFLMLAEVFETSIHQKSLRAEKDVRDNTEPKGKQVHTKLIGRTTKLILLACLLLGNLYAQCPINLNLTTTNVTDPGCAEGGISIDPSTSDFYGFTLRLQSDPGFIAASSAPNSLSGPFSFSQLMAEDYTLEVVTQSGCTTTTTFSITQPPCPWPQTVLTPTPVSINGGNDGSMEISFASYMQPCAGYGFTYYLIKNGSVEQSGPMTDENPDPNRFGMTISNLTGGIYEVKVTRGSNYAYSSACLIEGIETVIEPACDLSFGSVVNQPTAAGCVDGSIELFINGTTANDYYVIEVNQNGIFYGTYYPAETSGVGYLELPNLPAGSYEFILQNGVTGGTCTYTNTLALNDPTCDLFAFYPFQISNPSGSGCNNGSADIELTGATCSGIYYGSLFKNGNYESPYFATETSGTGVVNLTSLSSGAYVFEIQNGPSCTASVSFAITEPSCDLFITNFSKSNPITGYINGSAHVNFSGATCQGYYQVTLLQNGSAFYTTSVPETSGSGELHLTLIPAGNYQLIVNNGNESCSISQLFIMTEEPCNYSITGIFPTSTPVAEGCTTGNVSFFLAGSTGIGGYLLELTRNGLLYQTEYVTQFGEYTYHVINNLPSGNYTVSIQDAYDMICLVTESFVINGSSCNVAITNPVVVNATVIGGTGSITATLSGTTCVGEYYTQLLYGGNQTDQTIPASNPQYSASGLATGEYILRVYSGSNLGNDCYTTYNFTIQEPCLGTLTNVSIDSTAGPCGTINASMNYNNSVIGTYYYVLLSVNGAPHFIYETFFGDGLPKLIQFLGLQNGQYDVLVSTSPTGGTTGCNATASFYIQSEYCDAVYQSTSVQSSSNGCENGEATITFYDAISCGGTYYGELYYEGSFLRNISHNAGAGIVNFPIYPLYAGNYTYTIYTIGNDPVNFGCPISGSFYIGDQACSIAMATPVTGYSCTGGTVDVNVTGTGCDGSFFAALYDGVTYNLVSSYSLSDNGGSGTTVSFGGLAAGDYLIYVFSHPLSYCFDAEVITIAPPACDLQIQNVITNPVTSGSNGSFTYDISGTTCSGSYYATLYNGLNLVEGHFVFYGGPPTPDTFTGLAAGVYNLIVQNESCYTQQEIIIQNAPPCTINLTENYTTPPSAPGASNGTFSFNINETSCVGYFLMDIFKDGVFLYDAYENQTGASTLVTITGLAAGNYSVIVTNGCSGSGGPCSGTITTTIIDPIPCDLTLTVNSSSNPSAYGCTNGSINFTFGGNTTGGVPIVATVTRDSTTFIHVVNGASGSNTNEVLSGLTAGYYRIRIDYPFSGACYQESVVPLFNPICNLAIENTAITYNGSAGCENAVFEFDLNGSYCTGTVAQATVQVINNSTSAVVLTTTVPINSGAILPALNAGNYQINAVYGSCSASYNLVVNPIPCDVALTNFDLTLSGSGACTQGVAAFDVTGNHICNGLYVPVAMQVINTTTGSVILNSQVIENAVLPGLPPGSYSIELSSNNGNCTLSYPFTVPANGGGCDVVINNPVIVSTTGTGACTQGSFTISVDGTTTCGSSSVTLYLSLFYNGALVGTSPILPGISIPQNNVPAGEYKFIAFTSVDGTTPICSDTLIHYIQQNPCDVAITNFLLQPSSGAGACTFASFQFMPTGSISCPSGNLPMYTILYRDGNFISINPSTPGTLATFPSMQHGDYRIILATTADGINFLCADTLDFSINQNPCNVTVSITNLGPVTGSGACSYGSFTMTVSGDNYCSTYTHPLRAQLYYNGTLMGDNAVTSGVPIVNPSTPAGNYRVIGYTTLNGSDFICADTVDFVIAPNACDLAISNFGILTQSGSGICTSTTFGFTPTTTSFSCPSGSLTLLSILTYNGTTGGSEPIAPNVTKLYENMPVGNYQIVVISTIDGISVVCADTIQFTITPLACDVAITNFSLLPSTGNGICTAGSFQFTPVGTTTCGATSIQMVAQAFYNGNPNGSSIVTPGLPIVIENQPAGNYQIILSTGDGSTILCADTISFTINQNPCDVEITNFSLLPTTGNGLCTSGSFEFTPVGTTTCGTVTIPMMVQLFYNGSPSGSSPVTPGTPILIENQPAGNYQIILSTGDGSTILCADTISFTINQNPCDVSVGVSNVGPVTGTGACSVGSFTFTITGNTTCGTGSSILGARLYFNNSLMGDSPVNSGVPIVMAGLAAGNYRIIGYTTNNGIDFLCADTLDLVIAPNACDLVFSGSAVSPSNGTDGMITVMANGSSCAPPTIYLDFETSPGTYIPVSSLTGVSLAVDYTFSNLVAGNYRVVVFDPSGYCGDTLNLNVPGIGCTTTPIITASEYTICPGGSVTLNSNYSTGNVWSTSETTPGIVITTPGTYGLTVYETNGCNASTSVTINAAPNCVPLTQLISTHCGKIDFSLSGYVLANAVSGATKYEFEISTGGSVYAMKLQTSRQLTFGSVTPALQWGTQYSIRVRAFIGTNAGNWGSACTIGFIPDPNVVPIPTTQLTAFHCGKLNQKLSGSISADQVTGANQYEFEFSLGGSVYATRVSPNRHCVLSVVTPALTGGNIYQVRVRVIIAGIAGAYGPVCNLGILNPARTGMNEETSENPTVSSGQNAEHLSGLIYPNPSADAFTVQFQGKNEDEPIVLEIYDQTGRLVEQTLLNSDTYRFGEQYRFGMYILRWRSLTTGENGTIRAIKAE